MTQVEQIQLPEVPITPSATSPVQIDFARDPMQIVRNDESQVCMGGSVVQITSPMDGVSTESSINEDDDVQIIFSAPRRRKKRRRKLRSAHSVSPLGQVCRPPAATFTSPEIHHVAPQEAPRRRSISVVQRLELCNLGEEKSPSCRAESLPALPCAVSDSTIDVQSPWFADSSYCGHPSSQFPSLTDYAAWWDQSLPTLKPRPLPSIRWKPLQMDGSDSNKRKLDECFDETPARPMHIRRSMQVSPRTTPTSSVTSPRFSRHQLCANHYQMYSSGQRLPSSIPWPNHEWYPFDCNDHDHRGFSPTSQSSVPIHIPGSRSATVCTHSPVSQVSMIDRFECQGENGALLQHASHALSTTLVENLISPVQPHQPSNDGTRNQYLRSTPPHSNFHMLPAPSGTLPLSHINTPHIPSQASTPRSVLQPESRTIAPPIIPRNDIRVMQSLDILRKPSLYSIPPWPPSSYLPATPVRNDIDHLHIRPAYFRSGESVQSRVDLDTPSNASSASRSLGVDSETRPQHAGISPAKAMAPASVPVRENLSPCVTSFEVPRVRSGRKHSPNLIVDIAETCQELLPFAELAERHEVPIQKVFDAFSAIIQLPLLRNADDRRRHGSLGKRRMKEYRNAKRAMEKAQEAEKRAQLRDMRGRVEDARRKGNEQGRTHGLLKSAVLNNAREVHRVD
ncbi:hypothetical protein VTL71DRAFT_3193 [Oculimacula yallundae]|uniref:BZIP domain-containing protein n=1 Tax=Oculimacula yallundae TaxID=86028 RepID=A0ABR4C6F0_9HELO